MIPLDHVCHGVSRALPQAFPTQPPNAVPNDASIPQNEPFFDVNQLCKIISLVVRFEKTQFT